MGDRRHTVLLSRTAVISVAYLCHVDKQGVVATWTIGVRRHVDNRGSSPRGQTGSSRHVDNRGKVATWRVAHAAGSARRVVADQKHRPSASGIAMNVSGTRVFEVHFVVRKVLPAISSPWSRQWPPDSRHRNRMPLMLVGGPSSANIGCLYARSYLPR